MGSPGPPPQPLPPPKTAPRRGEEGRGASGSERCLWLRRLISGQGNLEGQAGLRQAPEPGSQWSGPRRATHPPPIRLTPAREGEPAWPPDTPLPYTHPLTGLELFCVGLL